jgi:hypothetical protein
VTTTITAGQSLVDVALQELGSVAALFDLADAAGLAITDSLVPGASLPVPASAGAVLAVASYFAGRAQRINTGSDAGLPPPTTAHDWNPLDFDTSDFDA